MISKLVKVLRGIGICLVTYMLLYLCLSSFVSEPVSYNEHLELSNKKYDLQETLDNYTQENEKNMIEEIKKKNQTELKEIETKLNSAKEERIKLSQEVEEMKKTLNN